MNFSLLFFFFFILPGLGSAEVRLIQSTDKDQYTVGESATCQCKIAFDTETVELCELQWVTKHPGDTGKILEMQNAGKFLGRVRINSNDTHSFMTLESLTTSDTDAFRCHARCNVNQKYKILFGNEIKLTVKEELHEPAIQTFDWLHYVIVGINVLLFIAATIVCAIIIRKRRKRRNNATQ